MSKVIINNKKVSSDYDLIEKFEAGIVLEGWEVRSIKLQHVSLEGSYIKPSKGELFLVGSRISPSKFSPEVPRDLEYRDRKLLLKKKEIFNLDFAEKKSGLTIIPFQINLNDRGLIKVIIALAKGRKKYDKRAKLKEKDIKRAISVDRKKYNI